MGFHWLNIQCSRVKAPLGLFWITFLIQSPCLLAATSLTTLASSAPLNPGQLQSTRSFVCKWGIRYISHMTLLFILILILILILIIIIIIRNSQNHQKSSDIIRHQTSSADSPFKLSDLRTTRLWMLPQCFQWCWPITSNGAPFCGCSKCGKGSSTCLNPSKLI